MAKRRIYESRPGRTGKVEVPLVGWGSSLQDESTNPSSQSLTRETALWTRAWEAHMQETNPGFHEKQQLHDRVAQLMARNDRRHHPRLAQSAEISIQQFSLPVEMAANVVSADVQNFSRGGICV